MPSCCGSAYGCNCVIVSGGGLTVTGSGTLSTPYVLTSPGTAPYNEDVVVSGLINDPASLTRVATDAKYARKDSAGVNVKDYGAVGNGIADDTTAIQNALTAGAGGLVFAPKGIYIASALTIPTGTVLQGAGPTATVIKRKASSATGTLLYASGTTGVQIRDLTLDGNKAGNTNGGINLVLTLSSNWLVQNVNSTSARANAGYGSGITVVDGTNDTTVERGIIRDCRCVDNDDAGIYVQKDFYILIDGATCLRNGGSGIAVQNYVFPPVSDTQNWVSVTNSLCADNGDCGIQYIGFFESGASAAVAVWGPGVPPQRHVVLSGNQCARNLNYGIAFQGGNGSVVGNSLVRNGNSTNNGGVLFGGYASVMSGNTFFDNYYYGVDAGGCRYCVISGNTFQFNGATSLAGCCDISIGASQNTSVVGNVIQQGGSVQSTGISHPGVDGSSNTDPFPYTGSQVIISDNNITSNGAANSLGVHVTRIAQRTMLRNNYVNSAPANRSYILETEQTTNIGNVQDTMWSGNGLTYDIASAATLVIPDVGESFQISGSTNVTGIRTTSSNAYAGLVRDVRVTSYGSGYSQASPPTVTFTGGGGAGAAATAAVSKNGLLIGVVMTNSGSGYTSAPTVTFSSGVAAGVAEIGCNNFASRVITLHWAGTWTAIDGGNLILAGNLAGTSLLNTLTLRGAYGNWYETGRSTL